MSFSTLLLGSTIKATVVIVAALLAVHRWRSASAAWKHAILTSAIAGVCALPIFSILLPPIPLNIHVQPRADIESADSPASHFNGPFPDFIVPGPDIDIALVLPTERIVFFVWLIGALLCVSRIGNAFRAASQLRSRARFSSMEHGYPVAISDEIDSPATVASTILLPVSSAAWPADVQRSVLLHEAAHIRRRDFEWQWLIEVACAAYWFHPLVWMAARNARALREEACDDEALRAGIDAISYAQALVCLARNNRFQHRLGVALQGVGGWERRITGILQSHRSRRPCTLRMSLLLAGTGLFVVLPLAALGSSSRATAASRAILYNAIARPRLPEPDLAGDFYSDPESERVSFARLASNRTSNGPDREFIALLQRGAQQQPTWRGDLVAERAQWALAQARQGKLVEPLLEALNDDDWRVQAYAAWALMYANDSRAIRPLLPLLRDPVWRLRAMAAAALSQIGDETAHDPMRSALEDPAWQVRREAVHYFRRMGSSWEEVQRSMLEDRHSAVRAAASEGLKTR